jgi:uncharacterized protein YndB with AHSA1/START domain
MAELKHQIGIAASLEKVYAAVATQAGLRGWWTADSVVDQKVGGEAEFGFEKRQIVFRMKIAALEPSRRVVWTCHGDNPEWDGTTLTWEIFPGDGMTILRFTHGGWKAMSEFCMMCNSTWGELMWRLKDSVEGRNPGPHWRE